MRKFFKQLFCFHLDWEKYKGFDPSVQFATRYGLVAYECVKCGKLKVLPMWDSPINYKEK